MAPAALRRPDGGAGQTRRLLLHRAVAFSDKFSYWPAETWSYLQKNHTFLYPVENKHVNKLWPI